MAAVYFADTFLRQQLKLRILAEKLLVISQRFSAIPPFRFYALADGIRRRCLAVPSTAAWIAPDAQLELAIIFSA